MKVLFPNCFPYWIIDNKKIANTKVQDMVYSSRGFLLPCCWCDLANSEKQISKYGLFNEDLKLENNDKVEDVLTSDVWKSFFKMLEDPESVKPDICKQHCSTLNSPLMNRVIFMEVKNDS